MKWYRFFKSSDDGTTVTVPAEVTSFVVTGNSTVTGTTTQTGVATFNSTPVIKGTIGAVATGATPFSYKVATLGGPVAATTGGTCAIWTIRGAPSPVGPTPSYIGDILIDTANGKMYIASAVSAYTDWKLVTSA